MLHPGREPEGGTDSGLSVETERLVAARDLAQFTFPDLIRARATFGAFTARNARIERQMSQDGVPSYRLLFQDGVKLVYDPQD